MVKDLILVLNADNVEAYFIFYFNLGPKLDIEMSVFYRNVQSSCFY